MRVNNPTKQQQKRKQQQPLPSLPPKKKGQTEGKRNQHTPTKHV